DQFKFEIDINDDVYSMAAVQHWARHHGSKRLAIWILGGGVPKNYTLQGEPLLDQILNVPTQGFDIDVQFCVDPVDNGALSSCPAGEGHTWGKVSADAVETGSIYVHCDVTAVFPWLVHGLMQLKDSKRKHFRLQDKLARLSVTRDRIVDAPEIFEHHREVEAGGRIGRARDERSDVVRLSLAQPAVLVQQPP